MTVRQPIHIKKHNKSIIFPQLSHPNRCTHPNNVVVIWHRCAQISVFLGIHIAVLLRSMLVWCACECMHAVNWTHVRASNSQTTQQQNDIKTKEYWYLSTSMRKHSNIMVGKQNRCDIHIDIYDDFRSARGVNNKLISDKIKLHWNFWDVREMLDYFLTFSCLMFRQRTPILYFTFRMIFTEFSNGRLYFIRDWDFFFVYWCNYISSQDQSICRSIRKPTQTKIAFH